MEKIYPSNKESLDEIKADKETISDPIDNLREAAIEEGNEEKVEKILGQGASIYERFKVGPMVDSLSLAIELDKPKLVNFFIKKSREQGENIEYLSSKLLEAVKQKKPEIVKTLLEEGANVNYGSNNGNSPILSAIQNENSEILEILIDKGAHINTLDLIDHAISNMYSEEMLLEGENENLVFASSNENKKCFELLVKKALEKNLDYQLRSSLARLNQPEVLSYFEKIKFMIDTKIPKIPSRDKTPVILYKNRTSKDEVSLYDMFLCDPASKQFSQSSNFIDIDKFSDLLEQHKKELGLYAPGLDKVYTRVCQEKEAQKKHMQDFLKKGYLT